ncbi:MAG: hypothetical protein Q7T26_09330 [Dehalococcoidia bacterium]|nr:hypothetical protein [Dehalococcoidia bacterium]
MGADRSVKAEFDYVLGKARALLQLREIAEKRRPIENATNLLPPLPPPLNEFKAMIDKWATTVDDVLCEMVIVIAVTALEIYLEGVYQQKKGDWKKGKLENIGRLNQWSKELGLNLFGDVKEGSLREVFEIRHAIVHRGGRLDQKAVEGLKMGKLGQEVKEFLTEQRTQEMLAQISRLVESIERQI